MTVKVALIALTVLCLAYPSASGGPVCEEAVERVRNGTAAATGDFRPLVELREAILLTLGFGLFAGLVAYVFNLVRKYVYHDQDDLDTAFDAGGQVSVGLTATTIVSQWTWAATLLQSCTVASKFGISGPFWYAAGATFGISGPFWYAAGASVQIIVFAILSVELKMKAPGAKTYLQVIRARFGAKAHIVYCVFALLTNAHIVYCVFALLTNVLVTTMLMLGGIASMTSLVNGLTTEMAAICLAAVIGTYTLIGGLGATFYVSYFNTALIFAVLITILWKVYSDGGSVHQNPLGDVRTVYDLLTCSSGPAGNQEQSYLTFFSTGGLMFGVINIIGNFGAVFCDQSYWQSTVAARPLEGVWGFISGGLTWFAIPFSMATTVGLAYVALGTVNGEALLSAEDVDKGLVAPVVVHRLMGHAGQVIVVLMILMAVIGHPGNGEDVGDGPVRGGGTVLYNAWALHGPGMPDEDESGASLVAPVVVHRLMGHAGQVIVVLMTLMAVMSTGSCSSPGLVAPVVVHRLMGHTGQVIVVLMILMAVMSTGSAEIIAVTSIIVYDILKDYVCIFRKNLSDSACTLCGKRRARIFRQADKCQCKPVATCKLCKEEAAKGEKLTQEYWLYSCPTHGAYRNYLSLLLSRKNWYIVVVTAATVPLVLMADSVEYWLYSCPTHGAYRNYLNLLLSRKNWYIVVVTAATVPLVLMADSVGMNLGWLYLFMGVLIGAAVIPIGMALFWARTTAAGMIAGATVGSALALVCWLAVAATLPGGLMGGNFIKNTESTGHSVSLDKIKILDSEPDFFARGVKEAVYIRANRPTLNRDGGRHRLSDTYDPLLQARVSDVTSQTQNGDQLSMIVGNLVSILSGGAVCAMVSLGGSFRVSSQELEEEWEKTRSLDNPLKPWGPTYQSAYKMESANKLNDRPTFAEVRRYCRKPRITALAAGIGISLVLVILWPAGMLAVGVMNGDQFQHWVNVSQSWAYVAAAFLIAVPLIQEIVSVRRQYVTNKSAVDCANEDPVEEEDNKTVGISYIEETNPNLQQPAVDGLKDAAGPEQENEAQVLVKKNAPAEVGDGHCLEDVL
ncbi:hypothetical protein Bbelb_285430 [Branchiostoma belcheri]|nr:hypothetical protein Bbelb_285430 [Branchiostoma belcheri]